MHSVQLSKLAWIKEKIAVATLLVQQIAARYSEPNRCRYLQCPYCWPIVVVVLRVLDHRLISIAGFGQAPANSCRLRDEKSYGWRSVPNDLMKQRPATAYWQSLWYPLAELKSVSIIIEWCTRFWQTLCLAKVDVEGVKWPCSLCGQCYRRQTWPRLQMPLSLVSTCVTPDSSTSRCWRCTSQHYLQSYRRDGRSYERIASRIWKIIGEALIVKPSGI